jgi:hypothetical protein
MPENVSGAEEEPSVAAVSSPGAPVSRIALISMPSTSAQQRGRSCALSNGATEKTERVAMDLPENFFLPFPSIYRLRVVQHRQKFPSKASLGPFWLF